MTIDPLVLTSLTTSFVSMLIGLRNTFKHSSCCNGAIELDFQQPENQNQSTNNSAIETQIKELTNQISKLTPSPLTNEEHHNKWEGVM